MASSKAKFLFYIEDNEIPKYKQIYQKIKNEILTDVLKAGDILPSIREGAISLNVSRSSIISAYNQLTTEGYLESITNVGYKVLKISDITKHNEESEYELEFREENIVYINDGIDQNSFSRKLWKKYYNSIILDENIDISYTGDEQGELELRQAIIKFIRKNRGVKATYDQVIISSGVQNLISLLIKITKDDYNTVCLERPGYKKVRYIFDDYNFNIYDIDVLNSGIDVKKIQNESIIYTSPSYQYPLGNVMTIDKRYELINFANLTKSLIIEDDYASIIRYDGMPIQSLQGLDSYDNTVYLGSFSKTFLPSLRISFMVIPKKYLPKYYKIKSKYTHTTSKIEQLALAKFISDGQMEKHLKKINKIYKNKNQIILSHIKSKYKDKLFVKNSDSGFHMVLFCKTKGFDIKDFDDEFFLFNVISYQNDELIFSFSYSGISDEDLTLYIDKMVKILNI